MYIMRRTFLRWDIIHRNYHYYAVQCSISATLVGFVSCLDLINDQRDNGYVTHSAQHDDMMRCSAKYKYII